MVINYRGITNIAVQLQTHTPLMCGLMNTTETHCNEVHEGRGMQCVCVWSGGEDEGVVRRSSPIKVSYIRKAFQSLE